jgi:hypothetical protein
MIRILIFSWSSDIWYVAPSQCWRAAWSSNELQFLVSHVIGEVEGYNRDCPVLAVLLSQGNPPLDVLSAFSI